MYKKLYPTFTKDNIFNIDYKTFKAKGYNNIIFDLDNTLVSYDTKESSLELKTLYRELLGLGFVVVIISNGSKKRVKMFSESLYDIPYISSAKKPLKYKAKKIIKQLKFIQEETLYIGDQLLTDIYLANKLKFTSILVKPILRKTEVKRTKLNRKLENYFIKKMKKKDIKRFNQSFGTYYEEL